MHTMKTRSSAFLKIMAKAVLWIAALGFIITRFAEKPDVFRGGDKFTWFVFVGCLSTLVIHTAWRVIASFVVTYNSIMQATRGLPETVDDAKKLGLTTPEKFCEYMWKKQVIRVMKPFTEPYLLAANMPEFDVESNKLFRELFGRTPIITDKDVTSISAETGEEIFFEDKSNVWLLYCIGEKFEKAVSSKNGGDTVE